MPLSGAHPLALQQLSEAPGVFLIREARTHQIIEEAQAPQGLRLEIERLARQIHLQQRPAESNPLAIRLWTMRRGNGSGFQVSGCPAPQMAVTPES